jgi:hypothetical protein
MEGTAGKPAAKQDIDFDNAEVEEGGIFAPSRGCPLDRCAQPVDASGRLLGQRSERAHGQYREVLCSCFVQLIPRFLAIVKLQL